MAPKRSVLDDEEEGHVEEGNFHLIPEEAQTWAYAFLKLSLYILREKANNCGSQDITTNSAFFRFIHEQNLECGLNIPVAYLRRDVKTYMKDKNLFALPPPLVHVPQTVAINLKRGGKLYEIHYLSSRL